MGNYSEKKRIDSVDILRAVGILIMVMGHVGFGGKFDRYIHSFHMPIFFLISGYLFTSKPEVNLFGVIIKRAKRLLIPYVFYAVLNYVFWLLLGPEPGRLWYEPLIKAVTYNTSGLPICGALWFLTAMFFAETFYLLLDRLLKNRVVRAIIVIILAFAASILQNRFAYRLPLTIDTAVVCMGFLEIGRVFGNVDRKAFMQKLQEKKAVLFLVGVVLAVINAWLSFVNEYVNIKSGWYGFEPLFWINAIIGSAAFLAFAVWFDRVAGERNVLRKILVRIGKTSMVFLGLNQLVILLAVIAFTLLNLNINIYVAEVLGLVVSLLVLYAISCLVGRSKNKFIKTIFGV